MGAQDEDDTESLTALLARQANRLDLRLSLDVKGGLKAATWPQDAWEAVTGAVTEALVNVQRPSGQDEAVVRATLHADPAAITISDARRGFDPVAIDPYRAGVRRGIVRRMDSVGGAAVIDARPGVGVVASILSVLALK